MMIEKHQRTVVDNLVGYLRSIDRVPDLVHGHNADADDVASHDLDDSVRSRQYPGGSRRWSRASRSGGAVARVRTEVRTVEPPRKDDFTRYLVFCRDFLSARKGAPIARSMR